MTLLFLRQRSAQIVPLASRIRLPTLQRNDLAHHSGLATPNLCFHRVGPCQDADDLSKVQRRVALDAREMRANCAGAETEIPIRDLIERGVFNGKHDSEEPLHSEKVWINQPHTTLVFVVNKPPAPTAIDPCNKLFDRNPEDNSADVE